MQYSTYKARGGTSAGRVASDCSELSTHIEVSNNRTERLRWKYSTYKARVDTSASGVAVDLSILESRH